MTNAPTDLLGLRGRLQQLTGLSAVDIGIVGDAAHARSGGYHIGRTGLREAGVWDSDYSVRLTRDRTGATESASAMDVGSGWRQGRAVWIRWNNLLANALRSGEAALMAVRAINYSPDGHLKWRIDRQAGFKTESSSDTVDIHTHIEWYRDTEGTPQRQQSLDRIAALASQAITGQLAPQGVLVALSDQQQQDMWEWLALLVDPGTPPAGRATDRFHFPPTLMQVNAKVDALAVAVHELIARPSATVDVPALAAALEAAGVGQVDVTTLATALAEHLPTHITLTGTVTT